MACSTGACASVVAGIISNKLNNKVRVYIQGGDLTVEWYAGENVIMTGGAKEVFTGEYEVSQ